MEGIRVRGAPSVADRDERRPYESIYRVLRRQVVAVVGPLPSLSGDQPVSVDGVNFTGGARMKRILFLCDEFHLILQELFDQQYNALHHSCSQVL